MSANTSSDLCPDCGGIMVMRTNRRTGEQFWGCSGYPDCMGTREANGASTREGRTREGLPSERARHNDGYSRWRNEG